MADLTLEVAQSHQLAPYQIAKNKSSFASVLKAKRLQSIAPSSFAEVLKWNKNQQRDPRGTATGGQFAKSHATGAFVDDPMVPAKRNTWFNGPTVHDTGFANVLRVVGDPPVGKPAFTNPPRVVRDPPKPPPKRVLTDSKVVSSEILGGGVNSSYLVELENGQKAVYKPEVGEAWTGGFTNADIPRFITNRDFSLAAREAMAFDVDQALGLDIVPETVLRHKVDVDVDPSDGDEDDDNKYDEDELRDLYEQYRERAQEDARDAAHGQMQSMFGKAKDEHVDNMKERAKEVNEIWNELIEDYPDDDKYGSPTKLVEHPVLPLGSVGPFKRRSIQEPVDPVEVLTEANVDVEYELNNPEKERVKNILLQKLKDGYQEMGDVDTTVARDNLSYSTWVEQHEDTEDRLLEGNMQSFNTWRQENGYSMNDSDRSSRGPKNKEAPHPDGGSLQRFIADMDTYGGMTSEDGAKFAVLDYVIGSMDRHGGNTLYHDDKPVAIDNGYSMPGASTPDGFSFRTEPVKKWLKTPDTVLEAQLEDVNNEIAAARGSDYRNEKAVPQGLLDQYNDIQKEIAKGPAIPLLLRKDVQQRLEKTDWTAFIAKHPGLSDEEKSAFLGRITNMTQALATSDGLAKLWKKQDITY